MRWRITGPRRVLALSLAAAFIVATPVGVSPAWAGGPPAADLLEEGRALYRQARFEEAVARLHRVRERTRDSKRLAEVCLYLGLAHHGMNQPGAARTWFVEALTHDPLVTLSPARFKPELVALLSEARRSLRGRLLVEAPTARLLIDGVAVSGDRFDAMVAIGYRQIEARDVTGRQRVRRRVLVRAGRETRLSLAVPGGPPLEEPRPGRVWTWVAGGTTVAAAAVAVGFGLAAQSAYDGGQALLDEGGATQDPERYQALDASVSRRALVSNICWIVTGALAATTAVLYFLEGRPPAREQRGAGAAVVEATGTGLVVKF